MFCTLTSFKQPTSQGKPQPWAGGLARRELKQKKPGPRGKGHSSTEKRFTERLTPLLLVVILTVLRIKKQLRVS